MRWVSFVFFICLGSIGCDKPCPEDMRLGDIPLMESSLKSIPYQKGQMIQFSNAANDTLVYEVLDLGTYNNPIYLGTLCEYKETKALLYANSTQLRVKLVLIDYREVCNLEMITSFTLEVSLNNLNQSNPLDTSLVDILDICSTIKGGFNTGLKTAYSRLKTVIHSRALIDEMINYFYHRATYLPKKELGGQTFSEVYQQGDASKSIYYTFEKGIIGFEDGNEVLWIII